MCPDMGYSTHPVVIAKIPVVAIKIRPVIKIPEPTGYF
tara:strand:+ start:79 stop:192 length:114 start_codon:yes stop_codon:yes gene_type:complete